ncbi:hypothetical protein AYI68_g1394 [Smittium mucronatum]|uniref:Uncharacterized protein n=1 Tax=Smittium mucronatum TaxID=133383 RepID=A0A1R0H5J2_9FUNG|nr:hypothetical protein AYI68_g1394 [Smittium mucronatum]
MIAGFGYLLVALSLSHQSVQSYSIRENLVQGHNELDSGNRPALYQYNNPENGIYPRPPIRPISLPLPQRPQPPQPLLPNRNGVGSDKQNFRPKNWGRERPGLVPRPPSPPLPKKFRRKHFIRKPVVGEYECGPKIIGPFVQEPCDRENCGLSIPTLPPPPPPPPPPCGSYTDGGNWAINPNFPRIPNSFDCGIGNNPGSFGGNAWNNRVPNCGNSWNNEIPKGGNCVRPPPPPPPFNRHHTAPSRIIPTPTQPGRYTRPNTCNPSAFTVTVTAPMNCSLCPPTTITSVSTTTFTSTVTVTTTPRPPISFTPV